MKQMKVMTRAMTPRMTIYFVIPREEQRFGCDAQTNGYMCRGERGQWYPLVVRMLKICDDASENKRQLRKLDEWYIENPGLSKQLLVRWRSITAHDHKELKEIPIMF
jgi:hypothetical protein